MLLPKPINCLAPVFEGKNHDKTVIYTSSYCNFSLLFLPRKNHSPPIPSNAKGDNHPNEKIDDIQHKNNQMKKFIFFRHF